MIWIARMSANGGPYYTSVTYEGSLPTYWAIVVDDDSGSWHIQWRGEYPTYIRGFDSAEAAKLHVEALVALEA